MSYPSPGDPAHERDAQIEHWEAMRQEARAEIRQRIEQRDRYSIQLTVSLGLIYGFSFTPHGYARALVAAPLVSVYFTVLTLYSYRIHKLLAGYLRDQVEVEQARLLRLDLRGEWENYYVLHAVPGIRRSFFVGAMWVTVLTSMGFLWITERHGTFVIALIGFSVAYLGASVWTTLFFW